MHSTHAAWSAKELLDVVARHWGFPGLRPLQEQAMRAVVEGRDSLVVLPTGGGKSLCYQAPAVYRGDTTVVISPLISLMKDQVDGLRESGVPAVQIDSSQSPAARAQAEAALRAGALRLVFVSPERLVNTDFYRLLEAIQVKTFAVDEAHCISHWGHDFRPEYRQLKRLRDFFPGASLHAYTATATEQVRSDIIHQLGLREPDVLVGNFDRPNLTYRVVARRDLLKQVMEVIGRHKKEAGIIYCIRRKDVDELTPQLQRLKIKALPYHAGLSPEQRKATQEAFAQEECDVVVATVAFGMGIDRSNVRYVLHSGMPKSIEHYQQETGRAGRDGLEAECILLHSGQDFLTWKFLIEKSASEPGVEASFLPSMLRHLDDMDRYCRGATCRHRGLVEYFGQTYALEGCGACDICLGDTVAVPDAVVVAQKILSCVARVKEKFGAGHVISVLRGENTEAVRRWQHEKLSTYGLLRTCDKADVRDWIYQLISQSALGQEELSLPNGGRAAILKLTDVSWEVMRGQRTVRLLQPVRRAKGEGAAKARAADDAWEGVDQELFEALRELRKQIATERGTQPYMVFGDATLRELARVRPSRVDRMLLLYGIGTTKLREFGERFFQIVADHCRARGLSMDNAPSPAVEPDPAVPSSRPNAGKETAFHLFDQGTSLEEVMRQTDRARGTVVEYLSEYLRQNRPESIAAWVSDTQYERIARAIREVGGDRLKPIFLALGEQVPYDQIRLVLIHQRGRKQAPPHGSG